MKLNNYQKRKEKYKYFLECLGRHFIKSLVANYKISKATFNYQLIKTKSRFSMFSGSHCKQLVICFKLVRFFAYIFSTVKIWYSILNICISCTMSSFDPDRRFMQKKRLKKLLEFL